MFLLIFKENPFRDRILRVFSSQEYGGMTFDEFLDLHTVFNNQVSSKYRRVNDWGRLVVTLRLREP